MIEAGKRYVLRDGRVTESMHVATGAAWAMVGDNRMSWYLDGAHSVHGQSSFDVIREWREPRVHVEVGSRYLTLDGQITEHMTDKGAHKGYPFGAKIDGVWYTWAQGGMNSKDPTMDLVKVVRDSLVIEHGKRYVTRDGHITGFMYNYVGPHGYRWESTVDDVPGMTWMADGSWHSLHKKPHYLDLVREATAKDLKPEFKIEVGKHYVTRYGVMVGPMRRDEHYCPGILCCEHEGKREGWWPDGKYDLDKDHRLDLVAPAFVKGQTIHFEKLSQECQLSDDELKAVRALIAPVKVPTDLTKEHVLGFLRTHKRALLTKAFTFTSTPQGYAHWRKIADGGELTVEDYKYLVSLL